MFVIVLSDDPTAGLNGLLSGRPIISIAVGMIVVFECTGVTHGRFDVAGWRVGVVWGSKPADGI